MISFPGWLPAFTDIPDLVAGFTTRSGGFSAGPYGSRNLGFASGDDVATVAANWHKTLAELALENRPLALPRMNHGTSTVFVTDAEIHASGSPDYPETGGLRRFAPRDTDALASPSREIVLSVTMADCMAILFVDTKSKWLGAVHAGWRGTRGHILAKSLGSLFATGKAKPENLRLCMGPALSARRLGLGAEIIETVDPRYRVPLPSGSGLDMRAWNRDQALACGLKADQIESVEGCTFEDESRFFSYRRDGAQSGRMAALLAWR